MKIVRFNPKREYPVSGNLFYCEAEGQYPAACSVCMQLIMKIPRLLATGSFIEKGGSIYVPLFKRKFLRSGFVLSKIDLTSRNIEEISKMVPLIYLSRVEEGRVYCEAEGQYPAACSVCMQLIMKIPRLLAAGSFITFKTSTRAWSRLWRYRGFIRNVDFFQFKDICQNQRSIRLFVYCFWFRGYFYSSFVFGALWMPTTHRISCFKSIHFQPTAFIFSIK